MTARNILSKVTPVAMVTGGDQEKIPLRLMKTSIPVNTKHLYNICTMLDQRRKRCAEVLQMLCKCFLG